VVEEKENDSEGVRDGDGVVWTMMGIEMWWC
jgi:hypothetical protein